MEKQGKSFLNQIKKISTAFLENETMASHCSFRCGGRVNYYCEPKNKKALVEIIKLCEANNLKYYILGAGTKLLFLNFDGLIISLKNLRSIEYENGLVAAEGGVNLYRLNMFVCECNLSGLEWSYGIPGSVGGACIMNAGAYKHDMAEIIEKVEILDKGRFKTLPKNKFWFEYRNSFFKQKNLIVTKVYYLLKQKENNKSIKNSMLKYFKMRKSKQPLQLPSAGSVFKRSGDLIPAKLIDELGLKGLSVGKAQVSEKHAGFIVNLGGATEKDIFELIKLIEKKVTEVSGQTLEREINIVE